MPTAQQIFKQFDSLPEQEKTPFLFELIGRKPIKNVNLVELFEYTVEFRESRYDAILDFADRFRKAHPTLYDNEYEFLELRLTDHAFDTMDKDLINRCLGVITRNPAKGIDTITILTLYRLIYHGMYEEALTYSQEVWEPVANDENLMGYPELPFAMTFFLDGLEEQYEKISQGDATGWNDFIERMTRHGFNNEKKRIDIMYAALTSDLNPDQLIKSVRKDAGYGFIPLTYHFLRFMKEKYHMPFMCAGLFMEVLQHREVLTHSKRAGAFLYLPFKLLDKHIAEKLDTFLGSNHLEIFGKVWGLHYVYEFLFECGMIDQKHYDKMLATLATIKKDFLAVLGTNSWKAKFVLSWPASKADTLTPDPSWFDKTGAGRELSTGGFLRRFTTIDNSQDDYVPYSDDKSPIEADDDRDEDVADWFKEEGWDEDENWDEEKEEDEEDRVGKDEDEEEWDEDDSSGFLDWLNSGDEHDPEKNRGTLISGNDPYIAGKKTGRNEPCPCGSGKKYKKCCQKTK